MIFHCRHRHRPPISNPSFVSSAFLRAREWDCVPRVAPEPPHLVNVCRVCSAAVKLPPAARRCAAPSSLATPLSPPGPPGPPGPPVPLSGYCRVQGRCASARRKPRGSPARISDLPVLGADRARQHHHACQRHPRCLGGAPGCLLGRRRLHRRRLALREPWLARGKSHHGPSRLQVNGFAVGR